MRKLGRGGEVLATCGTIALGEGCHIFTSNAAPNASFKHFGACVKRTVAADHEKLREVMGRAQGTLARRRDAKVGIGISLAKS